MKVRGPQENTRPPAGGERKRRAAFMNQNQRMRHPESFSPLLCRLPAGGFGHLLNSFERKKLMKRSLSELLQKGFKGKDSVFLSGANGPLSQVRICAHNYESVEQQIVKLKLIIYILIMLFEVVLPQQKFTQNEQRKFDNSVESFRDFFNRSRLGTPI